MTKTKDLANSITVDSVLQVYNGNHIDSDLVVLDGFNSIPLIEMPRRMGCLLLALCLKGSATYTVDTVQYTVSANDLIIISEGQVISKDVSELSSLFLFSRTHPVCTLLPSEIQPLMSYCNIIREKTGNTTHHFRKDIVRSLFTAMIYDISNAIYRIQALGTRKYTRAEDIFTRFIKLVELYYRRERRVSWYADKLDITAKYLSESVKQVSKRTANEWIDNYVTIALRVLLRNTNKSIKEITQEMNFPNQSFLGTFFKDHVGMTPTAYRKGTNKD